MHWMHEEDYGVFEMTNEIESLISEHIDFIKKIYPGIKIETEEFNGEVFVNINSIEVSEEIAYQKFVYEFCQMYFVKGWIHIYWGVNTNIV